MGSVADYLFQWQNQILIFIMFSVIGYLYEEILLVIYRKPMENRGFLHGPYLPIYGFGGIISIFSIGKLIPLDVIVNNKSIKALLIFLLITFISTIVELIGGFIMHKFFNLRLWDYSKRHINFKGYITPDASIRFGLGGIFIYYYMIPLLEKIINNYSVETMQISAIIAILIMGIDFVYTIKSDRLKNKNLIRKNIKEFKEEMKKEINEKKENIEKKKQKITTKFKDNDIID
ncbi:putative ABC transporter permease [Peptoniphilus stercorisuis]|uniref:Membrane protein n=1 Tax=Peptoniphilus stercorisuis TaxID=1436965 RepID=A0ABS4KA99_9FIRM|nr:putative ABC transporter permease [Peptoniphilus stercorisuis]MBP2024699.1 putative membrane protein [Peptoniphilus stercorisuis]